MTSRKTDGNGIIMRRPSRGKTIQGHEGRFLYGPDGEQFWVPDWVDKAQSKKKNGKKSFTGAGMDFPTRTKRSGLAKDTGVTRSAKDTGVTRKRGGKIMQGYKAGGKV